jgi:hypothetical protein
VVVGNAVEEMKNEDNLVEEMKAKHKWAFTDRD